MINTRLSPLLIDSMLIAQRMQFRSICIAMLCLWSLSAFALREVGLPRTVNRISSLFVTSFTAVSTITPDGEITKEVLSKGTGKLIEAGDILAVEYSAFVHGSKKPFAQGNQQKFTFKDGSMVKGWDISVGSMRIGEKARFTCGAKFGYGDKGIANVIPANSKIDFEIHVLAWLGNQLRPESLFQKDLEIDPFIASTPEAIQADFERNQLKQKNSDKYDGSILDIYLRRLKNISFGFGGSGFFVSQSGERPPWYLNPNITFPAMILFVLAAFSVVFTAGGVREKGMRAVSSDIDVSSVMDSAHSSLLAQADTLTQILHIHGPHLLG